MNISKRLITTLSIAMLALAFVGAYGVTQLFESQQRFEYIQINTLPSIKELAQAKDNLADIRILVLQLLDNADVSQNSQAEQALAAADQQFDQHLANAEREDISDSSERAMLEADKANMTAYRAARQEFFEMIKADSIRRAQASLQNGPMYNTAKALLDGINKQFAYNIQLSNDLRAANTQAYTRAFRLLIGITLATLLLAAFLTSRLHRNISRSIGGVQRALAQVNQSLDLTLRAPVERMDEIGHTAQAFNKLIARMAELISEVRLSSDSVSVAAKEISAGNLDLSARTEQQAASLGQTAASMEQLTSTVKQNSDSARAANSLAVDAAAIADQGQQVVKRMVDTMNEIAGSSDKIADITSLIEGIAFQTNILALNAAVEAARAGEQGRGFAVVASEVRNLAQRSSSAAKEIKELIGSSVATIQSGSEQAKEVGRTTLEVQQAVKRVSEIIGRITQATDQQGQGIEQVSHAVGQMDQVTQQNAALVEQAAAAAQSLDEQAMRLSEMVAVFTVTPAKETSFGASLKSKLYEVKAVAEQAVFAATT